MSSDYRQAESVQEEAIHIENVLLENPNESRNDIVFIWDTYNTDVVGANNVGLDAIWLNHKKESSKT